MAGFAWQFASKAATGDHASQFTGDKNINIAPPVSGSVLPLVIICAIVFVFVLKGKL